MKKLIFFLSTLCVVLPIYANTKKEILEIVKTSINNTSFKANFRYTSFDRITSTVLYDYSASITVCEKMYALKTDNITMISNGTTVWTYLKKETELQLNKASDQLNIWNILPNCTKYYRIKNLQSIEEKNKNYYLVELEAKDKENDFKKLVIKINPQTKQLIQVQVYELEETLHVFDISSIDSTKKLPKSFFTFDTTLHKKLEIVDLR